jgi:hypothetical protein
LFRSPLAFTRCQRRLEPGKSESAWQTLKT